MMEEKSVKGVQKGRQKDQTGKGVALLMMK